MQWSSGRRFLDHKSAYVATWGDASLIYDGQKLLIDACIEENVARYIISDWSLDYHDVEYGQLPQKTQ